MSATRLTKDLRNIICNTLMERAYVERKEELDHMERNLGMEVYNDRYPLQVQEQMHKLPKDFFEESTVLRVAFNGISFSSTCRKP